MSPSLLNALIPALAVVDGLIHLTLVVFIFRFDFSRGQLPVLFLLNGIGYLVLGGAFLASRTSLLARRRLVDVALAVFALATMVGWFVFTGGRGNPFNLGYTSKVVEVVLLALLALHVRSLAGTPSTTTTVRHI